MRSHSWNCPVQVKSRLHQASRYAEFLQSIVLLHSEHFPAILEKDGFRYRRLNDEPSLSFECMNCVGMSGQFHASVWSSPPQHSHYSYWLYFTDFIIYFPLYTELNLHLSVSFMKPISFIKKPCRLYWTVGRKSSSSCVWTHTCCLLHPCKCVPSPGDVLKCVRARVCAYVFAHVYSLRKQRAPDSLSWQTWVINDRAY